MNKKICVYTCITANYDNLHEVNNPEKNTDYLCFTNNRNLKSNTWKIIYIKNDGLDDHHLSRKIKMLGHPIISKNYDISIWMDASVVWEKSINDFVKKYFNNTSFSAFKHNARNSIGEEAIACLKYNKDSKENILKTLSFLESEGFPDNLGLYEMTVFIKKHNDPDVIKAMELWFDLNQKYSKRDQLSFMYVIWKTKLKVHPIALNVWDNPWFFNQKHLSNQQLKECRVYYGNSEESFDFNKYYVYKYQKNASEYFIETTIPNDTQRIELIPIDSIGILYNNIVFKPKPTKTEMPDAILYQNGSISYIENNYLRIYGDFKKGQKLSFSMQARQLNSSELFQIIQNLKFELSSLAQQLLTANNEKQNLLNTLDQTNKQLQSITSSKSWKIVQSIRKRLP